MKKVIFLLLVIITTKINATENNISELYQKAKTGNPSAELAYAKALYPTSKKEAFKWAQKAADQGSGEAWYWMGYNSSLSDSFIYYTHAAKLGYPQAFSTLIDLYFLSGKDADYTKAKEFADLAQQKNISIGSERGDAQEKRNTIDICFTAGLARIPSVDFPNQNEKREFNNNIDCDSYLLGLGTKRNYIKYRKCVLAQKEIDDVSLAEIYANGWGVTRNEKLALGLICHAEGLAPAELYSMVKALHEMQSSKTLSKNFDFCEYITSGRNMGTCAAREEKITNAKRTTTLEQITSKWPQGDRTAFAKLQKAAENFFDVHSTSELDMSGTARGMIAINEKSSLADKFLDAIKKFEDGQLPKNNDFKEADTELNRIYAKLMKVQFSDQTGTLNKQGFIDTQRAWIAYRDAWVNFGVLHYPKTTPEIWKTWVTKNRIQQLNEILQQLI